MAQGNPYLARGEAKRILMKSIPVSLRYERLCGSGWQKAEADYRQPERLAIRDLRGIINADRAMTTGNQQINQGNLEGFVVEKAR